MLNKHAATWQEALKDVITDPKELCALLGLNISDMPNMIEAAAQFPLKVPRGFVLRMKKNNLQDPLLKQVLPLHIELDPLQAGYQKDALEEAKYNPVPGLLHKYRGRVLVMFSGACAVHCRYCFRRHFPYEDNNPGRQGWEKIFSYIQSDITITEVILSGGDPLVMNDAMLKQFTDQLATISHVKRLRIHTRIPVVLPERITPDFIGWIKQLPFDFSIVLHINHPLEIDDAVREAINLLRETKTTLLNQSVILKDVNDNVETLVALSETLFSAGVLPYYLHLLDKVQGAMHFDMDIAVARALHEEMRACLPGYLVPRLVYEQAGANCKQT